MTEVDGYTAAQAGDPRTPGQVLADIAALRPDLRAAVAANPAAYPGLLQWLSELGEPAVDAALRQRHQAPTRAPAAPQAGVRPAPVAPYQGTPGGYPGGPAAPYPGPTTPGYAGAPPQSYPAPTAGYPGGPSATYPGAPTGYAGGPPAAYPGAPLQPFGQPAGIPPRKSNLKALWIVLAVVGVLVVVGIVAAILIGRSVFNAVKTVDIPGIQLAALHAQCANGDWAACDDLYDRAPAGSDEETFGATCGNRDEAQGGQCAALHGTGAGIAPSTDPSTALDANAYGDDPTLDALWDACAGGDLAACDNLYDSSPVGSEYETFGDTCGNTTAGGNICAEGTAVEGPNTHGDDPALDALWDSCAAGSDSDCDALFDQAPAGSDYEKFGNTCAGRSDGSDYCVP
ncbi:MAG TPA: hypothetical protein VGK35_10110 [Actinotalea sp.]